MNFVNTVAVVTVGILSTLGIDKRSCMGNYPNKANIPDPCVVQTTRQNYTGDKDKIIDCANTIFANNNFNPLEIICDPQYIKAVDSSTVKPIDCTVRQLHDFYIVEIACSTFKNGDRQSSNATISSASTSKWLSICMNGELSNATLRKGPDYSGKSGVDIETPFGKRSA